MEEEAALLYQSLHYEGGELGHLGHVHVGLTGEVNPQQSGPQADGQVRTVHVVGGLVLADPTKQGQGQIKRSLQFSTCFSSFYKV